MSNYGAGGGGENDYTEGSKLQPRYMYTFFERGNASGAPGDEDPLWFTQSASSDSGTNARVAFGILGGALPATITDLALSHMNTVIEWKTDRITVKPGIVLNPTTEAAAPDTKGSLMYDSGTDELKYWDGAWQVVSAGGLSSHALDGAYHTATGLTVGDVLSADSATTFSWKAQSGGGSHDLTGASHTEDATGGTGNVIRATGATSFAWATLAHGDLSDAPSDAHHVEFVSTDADALILTHKNLPAAHHAATVAGDLNHNDLANIDAGDINHLTDAQMTALHAESHGFDSHTGDVDLADLASYVRGSIIIGGVSDWSALGLGTNTYVLKSGATDVAWGQVDYSELAGTQPNPVDHTHGAGSGGQLDWDVIWTDAVHSHASDAEGGTITWANALAFAGAGNHDHSDNTKGSAVPEASITFSATGHDHDGTGSENVDYTDLDSIPSTFAPTSHGQAAHTGDVIPDSDQSFTGNMSFTGELDLTGAGAIIDLNPAHTVGANIIDITPSAAIGSSGQTWKAINIDMASLDPTLTASLFGIDIDLTGISMLNNPALWGIRVQLPGAYGSGVEQAILATGNARSVALCTDDYAIDVTGEVLLNTINAEASDVDKFLVDSSGVIKFRTGTEVLSDIGGAATGEAHVLATSGPHTGTLPLADLAVGTQGSLIARGATDWEERVKGTTTTVLKSGVSDIGWGYVDWSELTGTQPAPVSHNFDTHSGDVDLADIAGYAQGSIIKGGSADWESLTAGTETYVLKMGAAEPSWSTVDWSELSGSQPAPVSHDLTGDHTENATGGAGNFLKADGATTFSWQAHGLGYSDVGAEAANANIQSHVSSPVADAHHAKFTGAEAVTAVVAENPLALTNALKLGANSIEDSTGAEMIGFDGAGYIDFLGGQGTPSDNDVLAWDIASGKWIVQAQVGAGGGVTGSGTQWTVPVWDDAGGTTIGDSMFTQDSGGTAGTIGGSLTVSTITAEGTDVDKFLVSNAGLVKFRTGAETLSDIGAAASGHTIVSHDTDATGAELTELTDSSETTLHSHASSGLSAGDSYASEMFLAVYNASLAGTGFVLNDTWGWYKSASDPNHFSAWYSIPIKSLGADGSTRTIITQITAYWYTSANAGRCHLYLYKADVSDAFVLVGTGNPAAGGTGWRTGVYNCPDTTFLASDMLYIKVISGSTSTAAVRAHNGIKIEFTNVI